MSILRTRTTLGSKRLCNTADKGFPKPTNWRNSNLIYLKLCIKIIHIEILLTCLHLSKSGQFAFYQKDASSKPVIKLNVHDWKDGVVKRTRCHLAPFGTSCAWVSVNKASRISVYKKTMNNKFLLSSNFPHLRHHSVDKPSDSGPVFLTLPQ